MQLFYAPDIDVRSGSYVLSPEESRHCVRVLRLRCGDSVWVTDGRGTLCRAEIGEASPSGCVLRIAECTQEYGKRDYYLQVAVAPTKNPDRLEWFAEKATEIGIDRITPLLTEHGERRTVKTERLERVVTGAVKQSLKAYHPQIDSLTPLRELLCMPFDGVKLIAHCAPDEAKRSLRAEVRPGDRVLVLIGPEGDFSPAEVAAARAAGFRPVSLGESRLRTETAALVATHSVAFLNENGGEDGR